MLDEKYLENLDGMSPDELRRYIRRLIGLGKRQTFDAADHQTRSLLIQYGQLRADAMDYRTEGNVDLALKLDRMVDQVYSQLPEYARW